MSDLISHITAIFASSNKKSFFFKILNDTHPFISYNRAYLWKLKGKKPKLIGASGSSSVAKATPFITRMGLLIKHIKNPGQLQLLDTHSFEGQVDHWNSYSQDPKKPKGVWLPIKAWGNVSLALWFEKWEGQEWTPKDLETLATLATCYGATYEKFKSRFSWGDLRKRFFILPILLALFVLFLVRIPLRVVGPCEVVSENPIRIGAPLDGVIQTIDVRPGNFVNAGALLFTYNKTIALNELYIAQKQTEIAKADLHRLTVSALQSKGKSKEEREALLLKIKEQQLELKKEQIKLNLAEHHANLLEVKAPNAGVISMQNPEKWEGKAVMKGEEVMLINDPRDTIIKIWLPEDDLIPLDPQKQGQVFLHIKPEKKMTVDIFYISDKTILTEQGISSFVVEGHWAPPLEEQPKLGLKGTAILYGEPVSLIYWMVRRPWAALRRFLGV